MIRATVRFRWGDGERVAELADSGWSIDDLPTLARTLDLIADPHSFGPADGFPFVRASEAAAAFLGGTIEHRPIPDQSGVIY